MIRRPPRSTLFPYPPLSRSPLRPALPRTTAPPPRVPRPPVPPPQAPPLPAPTARRDRKSTRLNSSHANISYAVFCLKKKITTPEYAVSDYHTSDLQSRQSLA